MKLIQAIRNKLQKPYPFKENLNEIIKISVLFGLFVTFFLYVFQPFGIESGPYNLFLICLSYGSVTTFVVLVLNSTLNYSFPSYFKEEKWTVGREIFWSIVNISLIGVANAVLTSFIANIPLGFKLILTFQLYTVLLALIPIVFVITYNEALHNKKYVALSQNINLHLANPKNSTKQISIKSSNDNDNLKLNADELIYITSADNYIEIYFKSNLDNAKIETKLLRNTLKNTEEDLSDFQNIIRCHKSYIVNLDYVKNVSGNAQGYKLHLSNCDTLIPVSRKLNDFVKEKLTSQ